MVFITTKGIFKGMEINNNDKKAIKLYVNLSVFT